MDDDMRAVMAAGGVRGPDGVYDWMARHAGRVARYDNLGLVPERWTVCDGGTLFVYPSGVAVDGVDGVHLCAFARRDGPGRYRAGVWSPAFVPDGATSGMLFAYDEGADSVLLFADVAAAMEHAKLMLVYDEWTRQPSRRGVWIRAGAVVAVVVAITLYVLLTA